MVLRTERDIVSLFKTEAAAKRHIRDWERKQEVDQEKRNVLVRRIGERAQKLSGDKLFDATRALDVLKGAATLEEAATFYIAHHIPGGPTRNVDELIEDYLESRVLAGRRPDTIRDIRQRLGCASSRKGGRQELQPFGFANDFKEVPVANVTTDSLDRWLNSHSGGSVGRKNTRTHLVGLFNFALKRKYIKENVAAALEIPTVRKALPYVMPIDDVEKLMQTAVGEGQEPVAYFALCLFAGIRPTEAQRLDWAEIDFQRREIFIKSTISKTHDERWIEMQDNLVAWLSPIRRDSGPVTFSRFIFDRIRKKSGVRWKSDCMRHSFGSYHLGAFENAGKTALQMGHRELGTLFEHYRRAVKKEDAERFWRIQPHGGRAHRTGPVVMLVRAPGYRLGTSAV